MAVSVSLFDSFMPHGVCYAWRADILWLNLVSDAAIAIAYFSIPFALYHFLRKKLDVPIRGVIIMFSVFIFACGLTHLMGIITVFNGYYGIHGILKAVTAVASIGTAVLLYPNMPKLLALRSPSELEELNHTLKMEIDHRRRTESQSVELQHELAHMGRLTTMGQMATGLAHELSQPLLAISQSADTAFIAIKESDHVDSELSNCLDDIQIQTQRAGEIIRALRQFINKDKSNRSKLDLNLLIQQTIQLISPDARRNSVVFITQFHNVPDTNIDRIQIAQVLVNLMRNSIESIVGANSYTRLVTLETHWDKDVVTVSVDDTGPGLTQGIEPFKSFDTSKVDGMGMGLSISRSIIESHGGNLWFDKEVDTGIRFSFTLPATDG